MNVAASNETKAQKSQSSDDRPMLNCGHCTFLNDFDAKECTMCFNKIDPNSLTEKCEYCTVFIEPGAEKCHVCGNTQKKYSIETQYEAGKKKTGVMATKISDNFGSDMCEDDIQISCSLDDIDLFKKPHCLIYTDNKGLLAIDKRVSRQLYRINTKICVIGVCGLYRTGKSYLMNWIAGDTIKAGQGFDLGNTIQSQTKGIWIWCRRHPKKSDEVLVLLDTEGLDDPDKGDPDHDNKLFCLTLLLSSALIINVYRVFDCSCLDKLAFIANLSKHIKVLSQADDDQSNARNVPIASPRLIMCIRDFHLKSEKNGIVLTPDEYLEGCLETSTKQNRTQARYNEIKESIKRYFPQRKCFTLAFPATGADLTSIESLDEGSLSAQFVKEVKAMREYIYKKKPKYICNASQKALHGPDLVALLTTYVDAFRKDTPVKCETAYAHASIQRNERVLRKAIQEFKKDMDTGRNLKSKQKLMDMFIVCHEKTLAKFREGSFVYQQSYYEDKAKEQMKACVDELKVMLGKACQKVGLEKLSRMYEDMMKQNECKYASKDGYPVYEEDMAALEKKFFSQMREYDMDEIYMCLDNFKSSIQDDKMTVYHAATEQEDKAKYKKYQEENDQEMALRLQQVYHQELTNREQYMSEQLAKLEESYNEIHRKLDAKRMCSIM